MKKITLFVILFTFSNLITAQEENSTEIVTADKNNKWTLEAGAGYSKGLRPFEEGYFSSNSGKLLGSAKFNSYNFGARYMFSPTFGMKGNFIYDDMRNTNNSSGELSKPFRMTQLSFTFQGVINLNRLLNVEKELGRFGMLFHGGIDLAQVTSKTPNEVEHDQNFGVTEYNGGFIFGLTPQVRVGKRMTIMFDISLLKNLRQHFNWDGSYADNKINLGGELVTSGFGLSYSFGENDMHGDYTTIQETQLEEIGELNDRIANLESLMNDIDKDGVPDYLDKEPNTLTGVAVDTKGRMIDSNTNGIPDEIEKNYDNTFNNDTQIKNENSLVIDPTTSAESIEKLINEKYIAAYFELDKRQPSPASADEIGFMLNYLRNNPTKTIDIIGFADELGNNEYNMKLSSDRAQNVKNILIKAGIDASRMGIIPNGKDSSVDRTSEYARRLVRKVIFKITN